MAGRSSPTRVTRSLRHDVELRKALPMVTPTVETRICAAGWIGLCKVLLNPREARAAEEEFSESRLPAGSSASGSRYLDERYLPVRWETGLCIAIRSVTGDCAFAPSRLRLGCRFGAARVSERSGTWRRHQWRRV